MLKRDELLRYRGAVEIGVMRAVKQSLDPDNLLNPGKVLSKNRLTEHVYDFDSDKDSNVIEVYVRRLRQKLGEDWIQTRRGQGYVWRAEE